jgi:hypothetical protein
LNLGGVFLAELGIEQGLYMLTLNPSDNQGVRFTLLSWLLITGNLVECGRVLSQYPDGVGSLLFGKLLWTLVACKSEAKKKKAYAEVVEYNPFFVNVLLKTKRPPKTLPDRIILGSKEEDLCYLFDEYGKEAWDKYPAALQWLGEQKTND